VVSSSVVATVNTLLRSYAYHPCLRQRRLELPLCMISVVLAALPGEERHCRLERHRHERRLVLSV
jgi:hypothetical protein